MSVLYFSLVTTLIVRSWPWNAEVTTLTTTQGTLRALWRCLRNLNRRLAPPHERIQHVDGRGLLVALDFCLDQPEAVDPLDQRLHDILVARTLSPSSAPWG